MKTVILFRHGNAENTDYETCDFDRNLTNRGKDDSLMMAQELRKRNTIPQFIIHSGANRAAQTAEIIRAELNVEHPCRIIPWLYTSYTTSELIEVINTMNKELDCILIVGHNPSITDSAIRLCRDFRVSFPTAGNITIAFEGNSWMNVEPSKGNLVAFDYPKRQK
ncbi:MAG: histidine phosphatase family protein [Salinivirgaceae bacterium]|nr:histidine phosphatase family protein [Salinivirgaceae bacterium]